MDDQIAFETALLKIAPIVERLCHAEVVIEGSDGSYYRQKSGWSIDWLYR